LATMDLSEARGLVLFRVVREGIGISQRLSASGTHAPTGVRDADPRTRAPVAEENQQAAPPNSNAVKGSGQPQESNPRSVSLAPLLR
jgi:hypothetical protein